MPSSHAVIACRSHCPELACDGSVCVRGGLCSHASRDGQQSWRAEIWPRWRAEIWPRWRWPTAEEEHGGRQPSIGLPPGPCRLAPAAWPLPPGAFHQPGVARALAAPPQAKSSEEIESSPVTGRGPVKWSSAARLLRLLLDLDLDCACIPGRSRLLFIGFLSIDLREDL